MNEIFSIENHKENLSYLDGDESNDIIKLKKSLIFQEEKKRNNIFSIRKDFFN